MLKGHMLDENLHTGNEAFCRSGAANEPQGLNSICEHREKREAPNRVPVSYAEVLHAGALLPTPNAFLYAPPAHVREDDALRLSDGFDVVVGE